MTHAENIEDLAALYDQLKSSMQDTADTIARLEEALTRSSEEWKSKGAYEFHDAWHNGFKPSLTKFCQALAAAGSDVAFQHNHLAQQAENTDERPSKLAALHSPH